MLNHNVSQEVINQHNNDFDRMKGNIDIFYILWKEFYSVALKRV